MDKATDTECGVRSGSGQGRWGTPSVERPTPHLGSGLDLTAVSSSPTLGSALSVEPTWRGKKKWYRVICTPVFIAAMCTTPKCWKQPKLLSVDERINTVWSSHTMECYSAI